MKSVNASAASGSSVSSSATTGPSLPNEDDAESTHSDILGARGADFESADEVDEVDVSVSAMDHSTSEQTRGGARRMEVWVDGLPPKKTAGGGTRKLSGNSHT